MLQDTMKSLTGFVMNHIGIASGVMWIVGERTDSFPLPTLVDRNASHKYSYHIATAIPFTGPGNAKGVFFFNYRF